MSQHEIVTKINAMLNEIRDVKGGGQSLYSKLYELYNECGSCEFMEAVGETIRGLSHSWNWVKVEKLVHEVNRIEENELFVSTLF